MALPSCFHPTPSPSHTLPRYLHTTLGNSLATTPAKKKVTSRNTRPGSSVSFQDSLLLILSLLSHFDNPTYLHLIYFCLFPPSSHFHLSPFLLLVGDAHPPLPQPYRSQGQPHHHHPHHTFSHGASHDVLLFRSISLQPSHQRCRSVHNFTPCRAPSRSRTCLTCSTCMRLLQVPAGLPLTKSAATCPPFLARSRNCF